MRQYKRGKPTPEVGTPSGSVIVADRVLAPVTQVFAKGVIEIAGELIKIPASAPISSGDKVARVCPSKSTVIAGIFVPTLSTTEGKGVVICKSAVAVFTKLTAVPEIELASLADAVCHPAKVWSAPQ